MKIYKIGDNLYLEEVKEVPDDTVVIPYGWTRTPPPEIGEGEYAVWRGTGWVIITTPPDTEKD